ncbi:MAG TPA: type II secretion system protein GspG [Gammaproteobacteria bacterium]|nr:type II secretion system protein GspG [Gammaproteobacteria bacterium]
MVVVVILGVLAALVVPRIMDRPEEARMIRAQQDIRAIASAINLYRLDNFTLPNTEQGLEALMTQPDNLPTGARWKQGGYLDTLPEDPWGNPYIYLQPGVHGQFDLYSTGADGAPGGEGAAADIGNWAG